MSYFLQIRVKNKPKIFVLLQFQERIGLILPITLEIEDNCQMIRRESEDFRNKRLIIHWWAHIISIFREGWQIDFRIFCLFIWDKAYQVGNTV